MYSTRSSNEDRERERERESGNKDRIGQEGNGIKTEVKREEEQECAGSRKGSSCVLLFFSIFN